jgi:glycosyltransferase involved in cell wall biosynthesis
MLTERLGYRAPYPNEAARLHARQAGEKRGAIPDAAAFRLPAAVLHAYPIVSYSGMVPSAKLGLASVPARSLEDRAAWFLISPTWTVEEDGVAGELRRLAVLYRQDHPGHKLIFVCNTLKEVDVLQRLGEAAFFYNKTANSPEDLFRPLDDAPIEFDAIYNARLALWKRHELSLGVKRCAFLYFRDESAEDWAKAEAAILARHGAIPGHAFINPSDQNGRPIRLRAAEVNRYLNRAGVGLCLSEREGAMFASTEYLLAGLPVVTTASTGGRDVYHDAEFCWTVPADPGAVADAVDQLKARRIPRRYIRERTLRRLAADRERFLTLINAILEESGSRRRLAGPWPFHKEVLMEWLSSAQAADRATYGLVDGFVQRRRGALRWRKLLSACRLRHRSDD